MGKSESSGRQDYRSDLDMWMDMWDEVQESEASATKAKPMPAPFSGADIGFGTSQDTYYDYVDELLQEEATPNPVYPDSAGEDQVQPDPVWAKEDFLKEIEGLKNRLFALENRMARMGQSENWTEKPILDDGKKLMGEIEKIRSSIERVSDQLGVKNEPSPWHVPKHK